MTQEQRIQILEQMVVKLTADLAFALRHLSDVENIRDSDQSRMEERANALEAQHDRLRGLT